MGCGAPIVKLVNIGLLFALPMVAHCFSASCL
jgi:hypothetical protein